MEQYILYMVLKNIIKEISNDYKITFNDMDDNGVDVIGIYIKGAEPSQYRELGTGNYYNYTARAQLLLQCDNNTNSLFKLLNIVTRIRSALISTSNVIYNNLSNIRYSDGCFIRVGDDNIVEGEKINLGLSSISLLGETDFKGKTGQGKARYSLNFKINYFITIGGK